MESSTRTAQEDESTERPRSGSGSPTGHGRPVSPKAVDVLNEEADKVREKAGEKTRSRSDSSASGDRLPSLKTGFRQGQAHPLESALTRLETVIQKPKAQNEMRRW